MYSVFVGEFKSVNISKKVLKKLNECGLRGNLINFGDYYSIKVASFDEMEKAESLAEILRQKDFEVFIDCL